jgi:hypothetical protein
MLAHEAIGTASSREDFNDKNNTNRDIHSSCAVLVLARSLPLFTLLNASKDAIVNGVEIIGVASTASVAKLFAFAIARIVKEANDVSFWHCLAWTSLFRQKARLRGYFACTLTRRQSVESISITIAASVFENLTRSSLIVMVPFWIIQVT